jgi:hypothetical protein
VLPDWLSSQQPAELKESPPASGLAAASLETLGTTAQEQDDAVAWLEGLAAKHGAKPEELVTDPNARTETPPEWVEQARALAESQPAPAEAQPAPAPSAVFGESDELKVASEDETGIWLRGLAEKEIFAQPAEAPETTPEPDPAPAPAAALDDDKPAWLRDLEAVTPAPPAPTEPEPEEEDIPPDLPAWLQGLEAEPTRPAPPLAETPSLDLEGELPGWLADEAEPQAAVPTQPADWQPVGPEVSAGLGGLESEADAIEAEPALPPVQATPPAKRVPAQPEAARPTARPRPAERAAEPAAALEAAQAELGRGDIPAAIEHYGRLIKKGRHTEEVIRDLREALYRYPVEVTVWQALGDAYMRANRLQEALDAYTKAEELLR